MSKPDSDFLSSAAFNGAILPTGALRISPLSSGFMFGEGLFETVRVKNSEAQLLEAHHARLADSMRELGAQPVPNLAELRVRAAKVIAANTLANGSLKIVLFQDVSGWSELILARSAVYAALRYETGFRLQTIRCAGNREPLSARKSLNYLGNIRAKRAALAAGFDEPLFIDARQWVLEGATTNLFIVKNGFVSTPPLSAHILPGVMRAHVLKLLPPGSCRETEITQAELLAADEVFVTNALLGVMPVAAVDSTLYDLRQAALTRSIMGKC